MRKKYNSFSTKPFVNIFSYSGILTILYFSQRYSSRPYNHLYIAAELRVDGNPYRINRHLKAPLKLRANTKS